MRYVRKPWKALGRLSNLRKPWPALGRLRNVWKRRRAMRWFRPGAVVRGRYEVVKPLGEGSYGLAYLCRDRERGGRLCVLKHVQPLRGGGAKSEAAYGYETDMLDRFRHPSIPRLIERFRYRGANCFTMEYVEGSSLEEQLLEGARVFTERESLSLLRKLLDVVAVVHAAGVVHRDIRIANVIASEDRVHLIDFGLARDVGGANGIGGVAETDDVRDDDPPEKILRRRLHVESDFYAMGHLLLFLLYSAHPGDETESEERGWEEELADLSPRTKKLLRRLLMAEQPYASCAELAADLDEAIRACAPVP